MSETIVHTGETGADASLAKDVGAAEASIEHHEAAIENHTEKIEEHAEKWTELSTEIAHLRAQVASLPRHAEGMTEDAYSSLRERLRSELATAESLARQATNTDKHETAPPIHIENNQTPPGKDDTSWLAIAKRALHRLV